MKSVAIVATLFLWNLKLFAPKNVYSYVLTSKIYKIYESSHQRTTGKN